ncbi:hypothetical protein SLS54_009550 [Diplodia seriata]
MTSSSHHDLEKQLEDLLDRFPGFLQHASGSVPLSDLIRLDDLFLKLKLWKHDIKASKGTLGLVPAGSCLMIISEIEISDLLQQIDRLEETFNDHKDVATSGLPKPLEGDLDTLEESVNALVSHVEPFTRLLDPQGIQATSSRRIIGTRILNMNLLDLISNELVMSEFDNRLFLPKSAFARILSPENIKNALPGANSNLIDFVINKSPKVFATVLQASRKYGKELVAIMGPFLQNNLDDHELYKEDTVACRYGVGDRCSHAVAFNLLHDKSLWSRASVQAFYADRWMFHVPVFSNANLKPDAAPDDYGTNFYVTKDGGSEVNGVASKLMSQIAASDPEFENGRKTALSDLLHLVRTRLLVVENKENKTRPRASASDLEEELRFMVDKGMKDPSYLFSGKSRQGANLPIVVDDWKFIVDNEFALDAFREVNTVLPSTITESLCDICGDLNLADPSFRLEGNTTGFSEQRKDQY